VKTDKDEALTVVTPILKNGTTNFLPLGSYGGDKNTPESHFAYKMISVLETVEQILGTVDLLES
jgi:hypothetical protein